MEDLIYTLEEFERDFKNGIYTPNEYYNAINELRNLLNKKL